MGRVGYVPSLLCAELVICRVCNVPSCPTIIHYYAKKGIKSDRMGIFSSISFINKQKYVSYLLRNGFPGIFHGYKGNDRNC